MLQYTSVRMQGAVLGQTRTAQRVGLLLFSFIPTRKNRIWLVAKSGFVVSWGFYFIGSRVWVLYSYQFILVNTTLLFCRFPALRIFLWVPYTIVYFTDIVFPFVGNFVPCVVGIMCSCWLYVFWPFFWFRFFATF